MFYKIKCKRKRKPSKTHKLWPPSPELLWLFPSLLPACLSQLLTGFKVSIQLLRLSLSLASQLLSTSPGSGRFPHILLKVTISLRVHSIPLYFKTYLFVLFVCPYLFVLSASLWDPQGQRPCFIHLCVSRSAYHDAEPDRPQQMWVECLSIRKFPACTQPALQPAPDAFLLSLGTGSAPRQIG